MGLSITCPEKTQKSPPYEGLFWYLYYLEMQNY